MILIIVAWALIAIFTAFTVWRAQPIILAMLARRRLLRQGRAFLMGPSCRQFNGTELHDCSTRARMPPMVRHTLAAIKVGAVLRGAIPLAECGGMTLTPPTSAVSSADYSICIAPAPLRVCGFTQRRHTAFEVLPAELILMTIELLDYGSALALSGTNTFFRSLGPCRYLPFDDRLDFVLYAESFKRNRKGHGLACFRCFTVLRARHFERLHRVKPFERFGKNELARQCRRCHRLFVAGGEV